LSYIDAGIANFKALSTITIEAQVLAVSYDSSHVELQSAMNNILSRYNLLVTNQQANEAETKKLKDKIVELIS
jgi:hypothetical protein